MYERRDARQFTHKGRVIPILGQSTGPDIFNWMQNEHDLGKLDVYEPIKSYEEKWETKTKKNGYWEDYVDARPVPGTRKRNDLPPIYMQWKEDWSRRVRVLQKSNRAK